MFVVTVRFEVKTDCLEEFRDVMRLQATNSLQHEVDCHQFDVSYSVDEPTQCFLYEKYTDADAFVVHKNTTHFHEFDAKVKSLIESKEASKWLFDK